jgi:hypothetical protein
MKLVLLAITVSTPVTLLAQLPRLEPLGRIGCAECDGPASLASIQTMAVHDGRVYVVESNAPYIRVFGMDGRFLRAFGGRGQGPGELRLPIHVGIRARGELEVYDLNLRRFTRFDSTGTPLGTRMMRGFTVDAVSAPGDSATLLLQTDFRSPKQPLLRLTDGSSDPVRLAELSAEFPKIEANETPRLAALAANPHGGYAVGDGVAEYRIRRLDADGRTLGDIVRDIPRPRKSPAELAAERERFERLRTRATGKAAAEAGSGNVRPFTPKPEHNHFNLNALAFDDTGRLWVRTQRGGLEQTIFDIFDVTGTYVGEVRVPRRVGTFAVHDGVMAGEVTDENDVMFVEVWRVR